MVITRSAPAGEALMISPMPGYAGLRLHGDIDLATASALQTRLDELVDGEGDVHLDLAGLRFVDLNGAAVLVAVATRLGPARSLVLHAPSPALSQLLDEFWGGLARIRVHIS
jgi:anti-anti-sigma factor